MLTLGTETLSPYRRHETVFVRAGGGEVQHVPWNIPGYGGGDPSGLGDNAVFGGLGGLTASEKQKLAERIRAAGTDINDIEAILEIVPSVAERQEVATAAVAAGADAFSVRAALIRLGNAADVKQASKIDIFGRTPLPMPIRILWSVASTVSFAACVYHGYKRNNSVGWAIGWGFLGAVFPIITPVIAVAQGFAKPKRNGLGRAYRRKSRKSRRR